jgi:CsoR family transcriptional regulator, copper-sensing transcriptional repressor
MDLDAKGKVDRRLARLEGQVRGVRRMVQEDGYPVDILTQIAAIRSALDQVGAELAIGHVKSCILGDHKKSQNDPCSLLSQDELLEELQVTLTRLMRS